MKKIFTLFFAASLTTAAFAQDAVTFVVDNVEYVVTSETTVGLSGLTDELTATELTVPSEVVNEGKTYSVTSVEEEAIKWSDLTKLVLPEGVTELKETAIYSNEALAEVVLPETLTTLGRYALAYNDALNNVVVPAGVTVIPESCFARNSSMTNIEIKGQYTSIGNGAFYKVPLTEITIPATCKSIGDNAFQLCEQLTKVTLNEGLETLYDGAFRQCSKLTEIVLPESLKTLEDNVFLQAGLTSVNIPANVESIGNATFGQTQITAFTVAEGNANYKAVDGVVYTKDGIILAAYPTMGTTEYTVLDECRGIGGGAFYGAQIQKLTLPETMRAFDNFAFTFSTLAEMNTPASLLFMGEQALAGTKFTTFAFPEGMTTLYDGVMAQCEQLQSVTLPTTLKYVGFHAFFLNKALTEVHCLGAEPAYLDFYEESDHPFGYIDRDNVTVSVPKGRLDAYKSSYWGSEFSNLVDTEAPIFFPDSFTPATESELTELGTIEITFPTEATVENSLPKISVSKNSEIYGEPVEDFGWIAVNNSADKKTVSVFPQDEYGEGFVQPIKLEAGVDYFVKLPAGFIKDSEGVMNQAMTLQFVGKEESSVSVVESSNCFVLNTANGFDVVLGGLQNATVEMFSTTDALVNKVNNANGTVSLNADANGMYIIRVIDGNKAYTFKVVK